VYVLDTVTTTGPVPDSVVRTSASGGDILALANLELRFPLAGEGRFRAVVFVDAGFVGDGVGTHRDRLRVTPGAGIRVRTPIGPIRFDVGYNPHASEEGPLFVREGDALVKTSDSYMPTKMWLDHFRLHFSLGQAF
jgi:outer membrane protein insertion porin family/translocation and assembly module TamA